MPSRPAAVLLSLFLLSGALAAQKPKPPEKHYALIFGTAYAPDDTPLYGAKVEIRAAGKKHPNWQLMSDHRGEFAQRVPPGPQDYVITATFEVRDPQTHKNKRLKGETKVHIQAEERQDIGLHLNQ